MLNLKFILKYNTTYKSQKKLKTHANTQKADLLKSFNLHQSFYCVSKLLVQIIYSNIVDPIFLIWIPNDALSLIHANDWYGHLEVSIMNKGGPHMGHNLKWAHMGR